MQLQPTYSSHSVSPVVLRYAQSFLAAGVDTIMSLTPRGRCADPGPLLADFREMLARVEAQLVHAPVAVSAGLSMGINVCPAASVVDASPEPIRYVVVAERFRDGGYHLHALTGCPRDATSAYDLNGFETLWRTPRRFGGFGRGQCVIETIEFPDRAAVYVAKRLEDINTFLDYNIAASCFQSYAA